MSEYHSPFNSPSANPNSTSYEFDDDDETSTGPDPELFSEVTVAVVGGIILLAILTQWGRLTTRWRPKRFMAALRLVSYGQIPYFNLSIGQIIAISTPVIILLVYLLASKHYYVPDDWSPLGLRAGHIALGLVPFVFTLGSRINPIAWVTRIPHERLMKYHQWGARVIFLFALIHMGTMLRSQWSSISEQWGAPGNEAKAFFTGNDSVVSGTVSIVTLAWIVFSSFAPLRAISYEFFVVQHIVTVLLLLIALTAHLQEDAYPGAVYMYVGAAMWGVSILVRTVQLAYDLIFGGHARGQAQLVRSVDGVTRIRVTMKNGRTPKPGQHVYLRLLDAGIFQTHPFSVVSSSIDSDGRLSLELLVRNRKGLTKHLAAKGGTTEKPSPAIPVLIHGPYGHLEERLPSFDETLLIAGGIGFTFMWPIAKSLQSQGKPFKMIWTVPNEDALAWIKSESEAVDSANVIVHITGSKSDENNARGEPKRTISDETALEQVPIIKTGRPDIPALIDELTSTPGRKAVLVCGPEAMVHHVSTTTAKAQVGIIKGKSPAREIWLHREYYSW